MFKVGQKVVCVDPLRPLVKGEIYTCAGYSRINQGEMLIEELPFPSHTEKFYCLNDWRFRPLDETFAESVLENIKEQIKEEELICV